MDGSAMSSPSRWLTAARVTVLACARSQCRRTVAARRAHGERSSQAEDSHHSSRAGRPSTLLGGDERSTLPRTVRYRTSRQADRIGFRSRREECAHRATVSNVCDPIGLKAVRRGHCRAKVTGLIWCSTRPASRLASCSWPALIWRPHLPPTGRCAQSRSPGTCAALK
jgi:hypothetical protein